MLIALVPNILDESLYNKNIFLKNYIDKSNSYKEILTLATKSKKFYID